MNTKYLIFIVAILTAIHYLFAGTAPIATPARTARQAPVAPVSQAPIAPSANVAPSATIGGPPMMAPVAPSAPSAPMAPTTPQSANSTFPYTFTSGGGGGFNNGVPIPNPPSGTNYVSWGTNSSAAGPSNNAFRVALPYPLSPMQNTSSPAIH